MSPIIDFLKWLWSDWGRPNLLTRMGLPRIVPNLLTYLLGPFIGYLVMTRYSPVTQQKALHDLVHNPWILSAYVVFYALVLLDPYLRCKYSVNGRDASRRFQVLRANSKDILVRTYWAAGVVFLLLLLIGAFQYWGRQPLTN